MCIADVEVKVNAAELKVEMAELLNEVEEDERDVREVYAHLKSRLSEMSAASQSVPDDIWRLAKQLEDECCAQSQGR